MTSTSGIPSRGKQNGRRGSGFSEAEFTEIFVHIESVLPIISHDWENVCTLLAVKFSSRTPEALRRKFNYLVHAKPNTGNPDYPWQVRAAKTLFSCIRTKTGLETESAVENIDSSETEDDDVLIDPMVSPIFEVYKTGKINNHEIIIVSKTKIDTAAHTTGRKKKKSLPNIFYLFNFDDMPLDLVILLYDNVIFNYILALSL